jgi:hypothetical protein
VPDDFGVLVGWMGPRYGGKFKKKMGSELPVLAGRCCIDKTLSTWRP